MLVLLLIIFRKRKRVRKIELSTRFFIHASNIFIRSKDVYFAVEKPPIQLEKKTQKRKEKITFFPKKGGVVCASPFFLDETKKKTGRRGRGGKEVLFSGPLLQKRRKNNSEFHRRRTQQRALENRNFAHHSLVFSSLSRSVHSFIRFLPSVPVMGAKFMNVFFSIFFLFVFSSSCLGWFSPRKALKILRLTPPSFFSSLAGFCCLVFAIKKIHTISRHMKNKKNARDEKAERVVNSRRAFLHSSSSLSRPRLGACFFL